MERHHNPLDLSGRVALVTGAGFMPGRGMGRAISHALARQGAKVVAADLDATLAEETAEQLRQAGAEAISAEVDVSDPDRVEHLRDVVLERFGRVDILVNHAGRSDIHTLLETSPEQWDRSIAVNLTGPYLMTRAFLPGMLAQGGGVVIGTVSIAGLGGARGGAVYTAGKAGLIGLIRHVSSIYGTRGIRAVGVAPGYIRTGTVSDLVTEDETADEILKAVTSSIPRLGVPEEVADVVAFLASDAARHVNGVVIPVDGGWHAL